MKNHSNTFFSNIKSWWYNIFHKSKKLDECSTKEEDNNANKSTSVEERNIFDEYRRKTEKHNYLLQLQKRFENKIILENEISDVDKSDLEVLYIEQINNLKRNIRTVENKIQKLN